MKHYKVIHPFNFYKQGDIVDEATALKYGLQYFQLVKPDDKITITVEGTVAGENKMMTASNVMTKADVEEPKPKKKK